MHEMSIAVPLVQQLEALAREHHAVRVESVSLAAGQMQHLVPELLVDAFAAAAEGTCAQGADLQITRVAIKVRCRACRAEFGADIDCFACPQCNQADVEIIEGDEITLMRVTFEKADGD